MLNRIQRVISNPIQVRQVIEAYEFCSGKLERHEAEWSCYANQLSKGPSFKDVYEMCEVLDETREDLHVAHVVPRVRKVLQLDESVSDLEAMKMGAEIYCSAVNYRNN